MGDCNSIPPGAIKEHACFSVTIDDAVDARCDEQIRRGWFLPFGVDPVAFGPANESAIGYRDGFVPHDAMHWCAGRNGRRDDAEAAVFHGRSFLARCFLQQGRRPRARRVKAWTQLTELTERVERMGCVGCG